MVGWVLQVGGGTLLAGWQFLPPFLYVHMPLAPAVATAAAAWPAVPPSPHHCSPANPELCVTITPIMCDHYPPSCVTITPIMRDHYPPSCVTITPIMCDH